MVSGRKSCETESVPGWCFGLGRPSRAAPTHSPLSRTQATRARATQGFLYFPSLDPPHYVWSALIKMMADPNNRLWSGQSGQEPESHCSRSTPPPSARCTARARTAGLCWANLGKGPAPPPPAPTACGPRCAWAYLSFLRVRVVRSLWLLMRVVRALCVGHLVESCKQHVHCISGVIID